MLPEEPPGRWARQWDAREDYEEEEDHGWIGEDALGIWCTLHPEAALLDAPTLWEMVLRFRGGQREILANDWQDLSAYEYQVKLIMVAAHGREEMRRAKEKSRDE